MSINRSRFRSFIPISLLILFLTTASISEAALGWVGNMFPAAASSNSIAAGDDFDVYVQVYKAGVTEPDGAGSNITCTLLWSEVASFGGAWLGATSTPMTYNVDIGNNDEYTAAIAPPAGLYEFTAFCTDTTDNTDFYQGQPNGQNGQLTVAAPSAELSDARAIWLTDDIIAWNSSGSSFELHHDAGGDLAVPATSGSGIALTPSGTVAAGEYPTNPNITGYTKFALPAAQLGNVKAILKGEIAIASYDASGDIVGATRPQIQGVLDDLYAAVAQSETLGVNYVGAVPAVSVWAPTAISAELVQFADPTTTVSTTHPMTLDATSGIWSVTGNASWDRDYYLFKIDVFVPVSDTIVTNYVTDPYAVSLSTDSKRSQFVNLDDADLQPAGWSTLSKPTFTSPEDSAIMELHVRDFSINDLTVTAANRGKFGAFTETGSDGMSHILALQQAGLTHVHLLPAFDIASVIEDESARSEPSPSGAADASTQQAAVAANRAVDGFNWGYDPYHFGAPEGSYSTDPDGVQRILEFRQMVQSLNENGLRLVMDIVYNHTNASDQSPTSVLDKIVPGYYHRYDLNGAGVNSSCCADTASEYVMFEKLMIDTMVRWADAYKVDGFRFDLMNLHTVPNAVKAKNAVQAIDPDIYVYGEGWDFGSAMDKGLFYAKQTNMAGTGIGTFNDRIRDAAHGGYNTDPLQIRRQGFINGLSYDWNGYSYSQRDQSDLHNVMGRLRLALAGSVNDYTDDPQETVNYVSKHDNETLFDQTVFKAPIGTNMADRVRIQNLGLSIVSLSQGVPFYHLGSDMLRSKSLDRNSYDSGDWFNRVDFTYSSNNFGVGLPPAWDNDTRWGIMAPLLGNSALLPTNSDILSNGAHLREMLQIRQGSKLFRLETEAAANELITFRNGNNALDGLIAMELSDRGASDLDANYETIFVVFNANKVAQTVTVADAAGLSFGLHPVQAAGSDAVVKTASFDTATGAFTVPARTTAVFVSAELIPAAPGQPSSIDWVGNMFPAGGASTSLPVGDASGQTVYVQVYEAGQTGSANGSSGTGIDCYLHWGRYGTVWSDQPMGFNAGFTGNSSNDEYSATIATAGLAEGVYGYTAYCSEDGGTAKKWRDGGDGILAIVGAGTVSAETIVHLFEWKWTDIATECEQWLGPKGFAAVQVSPPNEHRDHSLIAQTPWWARYQPVSYQLISRSGTEAQFDDMVTRCNAAGVDVYVDAVINHMAFGTGTGVGGGSFNSTTQSYPGVPYSADNFHTPCNIASYADRQQVQECRLLGLEDLDLTATNTVTTVQAYLNDLTARGVAGFRIDGAKHVFTYDLEALFSGLNGSPFVYQEVIEAFGEAVNGFEYFQNGDVTEFDYSKAVGNVFSPNTTDCTGTLADLETLTNDPALMGSGHAVVFVDNHDNQRGHGTDNPCIATHQDAGSNYDLANLFMLAHPYGHARVMSSYAFADDDDGPPSDGSGNTNTIFSGTTPTGCNGSEWICEHRRTAIANMVGFRTATAGEPITDWWDNGGDWVAFGRNDKGFIAINLEPSAQTSTYTTSMPAGDYCDITRFDAVNGQCYLPNTTSPATDAITVNPDGTISSYTLASGEAFAIHTDATIMVPTAVSTTSQTASSHWQVILLLFSAVGMFTLWLLKQNLIHSERISSLHSTKR